MGGKGKNPLNSGEYKVGYKKPPQTEASKKTRYGGENENPRGRGFFKAEDTARAKLEKMITLSEKELQTIKDDKDAPKFERNIAEILLTPDLAPVQKWRVIKEAMDEIYGAPPQKVEQTTIALKPILPPIEGEEAD